MIEALFNLVIAGIGVVLLGMGMGTGAFLGAWLWFRDTEWWPAPRLKPPVRRVDMGRVEKRRDI